MKVEKVNIKRYVETKFETIIKRTDFFWKGISLKSVGEYLNRLNADKDAMEKAFNVIDSPFNLDRDYIADFLRAFDNEIELAEFYLELYKARKNPNFDKWVFLTEEERNKGLEEDSWRKKSGDAWERSNGRVKAIIIIKDNTTSTKVSLTIKNNSKMTFIEGEKEINSSNLHNKESIKKKIEEYKVNAESILKDTIFPLYCYEKRQFDNYKELLGVENE